MTEQQDAGSAGAYYGPFGSGYGDPSRSGEPDPDGLWFTRAPVLDTGPEAATQVVPVGAPGTGSAAALFPAPAGVPPLRPRPPVHAAPVPVPIPARVRRPLGVGTIVLVAAMTALVVGLVVGLVAGYAGARFAGLPGRSDPGGGATGVPGPTEPGSADPTSAPTVSQSSVSPAPRQADTVAIAAKLLPSTVTITVTKGDRGGTGSGFVLDDRGRIMTNNHVVAAGGGGGQLKVTFADGRRSSAKLLGRSPSYDLAVIQVADRSSLSPVQIGDSDAVQVGQPAIAIGSPLGLGGTVTEGIVSAKDRPVVVSASASSTPSAYLNAIQTDAPINPGNSGGPLVDAGGRVIGINSAILSLGNGEGQAGNIGLGFSIPINQAVTTANQLITDGKATYPTIGAEVTDTDDADGVRLSAVTSGGPAAKAGLRKGDVVTALNGTQVRTSEQFIVNVRVHRPKEVLTLTYDRSGSSRQARVTLAAKEG